MRRGAKPEKDKAEAKLAVTRKSPKNDAARARDLEKRLAEALGQLQTRERELVEAQEQQTATAEILRVISASPTDVQPVFDAIVASATRLCEADLSGLYQFDGALIHFVAQHGRTPEEIEAARQVFPQPPGRASVPARAILDSTVVQVPDVREDPEIAGVLRMFFRTVMAVPMLRDGRPIGTIAVMRRVVRPFSDEQIALLQTFADQAVIAIENVRLFTELEARNRDLTATSEILRVISQSQIDVQPVFDIIAESALRLCEAKQGNVFLFDGGLIHLAAVAGPDREGTEAVRRSFPQAPGGASATTRAILTRRSVIIPDVLEDPDFKLTEMARAAAFRSVMSIPMLRAGESIGAITIARGEAGPFSDNQIALLQTFADQAVIAIENVRLFTELQASNRELTTALDTQTATSDILRVISRSPTDAQPVFDAIVASAARLCSVDDGWIVLVEGDVLRAVSAIGQLVAQVPIYNARRLNVTRESVIGRSMLDRATLHIADLAAESEAEFPEARALQRVLGHRTQLVTPLLREGVAIGAILLARFEVRVFAERQIELLKTFADQAVIAIENVRLFTELEARNSALRESLEQQTATSEILRVISRSPTNVQPVLDTIVQSTVRLCAGFYSLMFLSDGERLSLAATHNVPLDGIKALEERYPLPIASEEAAQRLTARAMSHRRVLQVTDMQSEANTSTASRVTAEAIGHRAVVAVPMLREGDPIGVLIVSRREARVFAEKEVTLLQTFADQAVIAIENVRLFNELQEKTRAASEAHAQVSEALARETATSEILRVIGSSLTDAQPVFETIARSGLTVCAALGCVVFVVDGDMLRVAATAGVRPERIERFRRDYPISLSAEIDTAQAVSGRRMVHLADIEYNPNATADDIEVARLAGYRTRLMVPMVRGDRALGLIAVTREDSAAFPDHLVELLRTFADQAVIAIENVRLFTELQTSNRDLTKALDTQTATSDILRVISRSQTDVQPVFDAIMQSAVRLLRAHSGMLTRVAGDWLELAAFTSIDRAYDDAIRAYWPRPLHSKGGHTQAIRERAPINIADAEVDPRVPEAGRAVARLSGLRSVAYVPLLRNDEAIGSVVVSRQESGGFTDDEIALLQTFADQAVIAIENARLLTELQARTQELTRSVDQLTALGDVGRAVSSSLDLDTVLTTIVDRAVQLSGTDGGTIFEYDEGAEEFTARATLNADASQSALLRATRLRRGEGAVGQMAVTREPFQIPDISTEGAYESRIRGPMLASGTRSVLAIPLLHEERLVGGLVVTRRAAGTFTDEVVALLRTFATQSALAIQNARLFREIEDKSRQLEVASQHKSEFLANMSHELRTPLNAIIGFSEVLGERMFGELNEKQEEYLKDIYASGQHLLSLINDILDLSKIEAGRMELELTDFNLPATLDNALTLVRERAGRRGIALGLTIDERLEQIRADERKVRQVVLNLLSNAIKFTPEGGRIDVRAVPVDGSVEVSVSDTGVGIAPEDQEAIFEEFRQVGTAAKKVEGTGLGLALSRRFAELHGGRIWVESQVGAGSTFTFTIPTRLGA